MTTLLKCLSHSPLRGLHDPSKEIVDDVENALALTKKEVEEFDPELIIIFGPDHYNGLFYDLMPPFVVAAAAESIGDYTTPAGNLNIPRDLVIDLVNHLFSEDIDIALSHRLQVDHGCTQSIVDVSGSLTRYPVIPIIINSVAPPFPSYKRIRQLGHAVGNFIAKLNKRVLILGSGGLSHEPPVPVLNGASKEISEFLIAGRNPTKEQRAAREQRTVAAAISYGTTASKLTPLNSEWDKQFMSLLAESKLEEIDDFDIETISKLAGRSTHEVRTWVAAFSALAALGPYAAQQNYYRAINEWIVGYGVMSAKPIHA